MSKREVFDLFHRFGRLAQISLKSAYGFVQYHTAEDAEAAMQAAQGSELGGRKIRTSRYSYLLVDKELTAFKISSSVERRRRRTRKTVINESGLQTDAARAVLVHLAAAAWIGTTAGKGTTAAEEMIIVLAVPRRRVVTRHMDAAAAIVATAAHMTVIPDPDLGHLGTAGTAWILTGDRVPVHADVIRPSLIWTFHNDMGTRSPTSSCSSSKRYSETLSVGFSGPSTSVD